MTTLLHLETLDITEIEIVENKFSTMWIIFKGRLVDHCCCTRDLNVGRQSHTSHPKDDFFFVSKYLYYLGISKTLSQMSTNKTSDLACQNRKQIPNPYLEEEYNHCFMTCL
jgi:hypothetical protein